MRTGEMHLAGDFNYGALLGFHAPKITGKLLDAFAAALGLQSDFLLNQAVRYRNLVFV